MRAPADSGTGPAAKRDGRGSPSLAPRNRRSVRDPATGAGFQIEVAPANAIDAFYHPYAYAARREHSYRIDRDEARTIDG